MADRRRTARRRRGDYKAHIRVGAPGYTPESDTDQPVDLNAERYGLEPPARSTHTEPAEGPLRTTEL